MGFYLWLIFLTSWMTVCYNNPANDMSSPLHGYVYISKAKRCDKLGRSDFECWGTTKGLITVCSHHTVCPICLNLPPTVHSVAVCSPHLKYSGVRPRFTAKRVMRELLSCIAFLATGNERVVSFSFKGT